MIKRFIIWYLKRHNAMFTYMGYTVRIFTEGYYYKVIQNHNAMERKIINPDIQIKIHNPTEKGGVQE